MLGSPEGTWAGEAGSAGNAGEASCDWIGAPSHGVVSRSSADARVDGDVPGALAGPAWRLVLRLYENSLGLAFVLLFLVSWAGHAWGGFAVYLSDELEHAGERPTFAHYLSSARFWFESFENWESEFLSIAAMVWLAVYLRQRHSPESKPVHFSHDETGR